MEKNYLNRVAWIVPAVVLSLLALYWLPTPSIGGWQMRKIDLLSDIRNDSVVLASSTTSDYSRGQELDTLVKRGSVDEMEVPVLEGSRLTRGKDGKLVTLEDSIIEAEALKVEKKVGVTSIVDLSEGAAGGMNSFYQALDMAGSRPVRIAVLGDSFIEGDIMTAMLRELLQKRFGGKGCGYLPITSITASNRVTVKQSFEGWTTHKCVDRAGFVDTYNNLTGYYFNASQGAWVNMECRGNAYPHSASCTSSSLYYLGGGGTGSASVTINGTTNRFFTLEDYESVGKVTITGDIISAKWVIDNPSGIVFLGASMDCDNGVIVDNMSMRSSSGRHLYRINDRILSGFNNVRPYDLVIIMYGLNVAGRVASEFTEYSRMMQQGVENIKRCMPGTSVLLVSCSDREERGSNGFKTMKGVLGLIQAQKRAAINTKVSFWNLYDAMGGEGSIVEMVKKGEAARDYTHLTGRGGDRIARLLYDALMLGYENR